MIRLQPVGKVVISGNRHQDSYISEIDGLLGALRCRHIAVCIEGRFADYLKLHDVDIHGDERVETPPADAGAAISIGGDGTFLRTTRWIGDAGVPVLGINTGHLGFLASYTPAEFHSLADMLLAGDAVVEERIALQVELPEGCVAPALPYAVNEVAILKDDTSSMINVNVDINGHYLAEYLADGLLISTPTGSTGYSLSAGGPILSPVLDVMCITPVAPHTLTLRPFVVNGGDKINACTTSRASHYRVSLDGVSFLVDAGTSISIRKADFRPRVIRRPGDTFAATLRNKLFWGLR